MLGLTRDVSEIPRGMVTTTESIPGFEITTTLGIVEGIVERSFISVVQGGELSSMLSEAKRQMEQAASDRRASAIVAVRYEVTARDLEKSVVAYGTAVRCQKIQAVGSNG